MQYTRRVSAGCAGIFGTGGFFPCSWLGEKGMSSPSTTDGSLLGRWLGRAALLLALFASTATIAPPAARATHERASLITWSPAGGNAVEFTITGAWRRSAYSTANGRCRNPNDTVAPVLESI